MFCKERFFFFVSPFVNQSFAIL